METLASVVGRQLDAIERAIPEIRTLLNELNDEGNLVFSQALILYALTLEFAPDVILDLGTGNGNSAAVFALAGTRLRARPRILTFDLQPSWPKAVTSHLRTYWHLGERVEGVVGDLTKFSFTEPLKQAKSVIVFWDAHGYDVAETVLSKILPLISHKKHIVLCHDIGDTRYCCGSIDSYGGRYLWKGMNHYYDQQETAIVRIGNFAGIVDQLIALTDFCSRNGISLGSCEYDLDVGLSDEQKKRWTAAVGGNGIYMVYLLLAAGRNYHFPPARQLIDGEWGEIYSVLDGKFEYNIGVSIAENGGLPVANVTAESQHLASHWISLVGRGLTKLRLSTEWPETSMQRAPLYLQDGDYGILCEITGASSTLDGKATPLPPRVRVIAHPRRAGAFALPHVVTIMAGS